MTAAGIVPLELGPERHSTSTISLVMEATVSCVRLDWDGKQRAKSVPDVSLKVVRPGHPASMLVAGDNLAVMRALAQRGSRFMLAYLDPPFLTGRQHHCVTRTRHEQGGRIVRTLQPAFDDRWPSIEAYLSDLLPRIRAARDMLDDRGCLVVHVDPKTSHYVKVMCDELFGARCFASEIIWRYRRWPSKTKNFQRIHDVLLRYVRNPDVAPRFRQLYEPLAPSTLATWGDRKQRAVVDRRGRRLRSSTLETESPGTPLGDVWDIGIVAPVARERTGYPTQKPEALLERLLLACTEPGDLVLDPYVGSGTTLAVSHRLGRRAVGIDRSPEAIRVAQERLGANGIHPHEERAMSSREGRPVRRARSKTPVQMVTRRVA